MNADSSPDPSRIDRAVALAAALQTRAVELQTPAERRQQAELDRMLQTPADKATLVQTHRPGLSRAGRGAHGRSVHAHPRRAGHPALFQSARSRAAARLPDLRRLAAGRRRAAGEGAHAAARRRTSSCPPSASCSPSICAQRQREGRADERELSRRSAARRGGGAQPAAQVSRRRCNCRRSRCSR